MNRSIKKELRRTLLTFTGLAIVAGSVVGYTALQPKPTPEQLSERSAAQLVQLCLQALKLGSPCSGWTLTFDDGKQGVLQHQPALPTYDLITRKRNDGPDTFNLTVDLQDGSTVLVKRKDLYLLSSVDARLGDVVVHRTLN